MEEPVEWILRQSYTLEYSEELSKVYRILYRNKTNQRKNMGQKQICKQTNKQKENEVEPGTKAETLQVPVKQAETAE